MIKEVFAGWHTFIGNQKLIAVLFALMLFIWLRGLWKEHKLFCSFGLLMTAICLLPPTAMVLMGYQTRFYDYQWIWTAVPVLLYVAYGIVVFIRDIQDNVAHGKKEKAGVFVAVFVILLSCSSLGQPFSTNVLPVGNQEEMARVLSMIEEVEPDSPICLWAPKEYMAYAREYDGNITLFYGRNMWDAALNAYSYDVYSPEQNDCYTWIEGICENGSLKQKGIQGVECVKQAFDMGVTHLVLPEDIKPAVVEKLQKKVDVTAHPIDGYIVFTRE